MLECETPAFGLGFFAEIAVNSAIEERGAFRYARHFVRDDLARRMAAFVERVAEASAG